MDIVWIDSVTVDPPRKSTDEKNVTLMPRECRELGLSYAGTMTIKFNIQVN
jgi:hypothetical protein